MKKDCNTCLILYLSNLINSRKNRKFCWNFCVFKIESKLHVVISECKNVCVAVCRGVVVAASRVYALIVDSSSASSR